MTKEERAELKFESEQKALQQLSYQIIDDNEIYELDIIWWERQEMLELEQSK